MKNKKFYLKVYVDSAFIPKTKEAFSCYYMYGTLDEKIDSDAFISCGFTPNSTYSEYLGIEKTIIQIIKLVNKRSISLSKVDIIIYTDLQVLPRQYKKWIPPPLDEQIRNCYIRICSYLQKFHTADIFWIERGENLAGKLLDKKLQSFFIKIKQKNDDKIRFSYLIEKIKNF